MGTAHVEIYQKYNKNQAYPREMRPDGPVFVADEATSTTATTAGSRMVCPSNNSRDYWARIIHDEACYVAIGDNPTAAVPPALAYKTVPNVALELPIRAGQKISFKEVA